MDDLRALASSLLTEYRRMGPVIPAIPTLRSLGNTLQGQRAVCELLLHDPVSSKFPPSSAYLRTFLKPLINAAESAGVVC